MNNSLNIIKSESCDTHSINEEAEPQLKIQWEGARCFIDGKAFYPKIGSLNTLGDGKFNTAILKLDGQAKSELKWDQELEVADQLIDKGYKIIWDIDLGLFDRLPFSLLNKSQLMTLSIAIEHFLENVWPQYEDQTLGISIYEGSLNFSHTIPWNDETISSLREWLEDSYETIDCFNKESHLSLSSFEDVNEQSIAETEALHLYAADLCINYLDILAGRVPEEFPCFVFIDASPIPSPLLQARMLSAERAEHIRPVLKKGAIPPDDITWDSSESPYGYYQSGSMMPVQKEKASLGVCLPEIALVKSTHYEGLEEALKFLINHKISFRIIPEALLTTEWDALDELIVTSAGISVWGVRKLQGFCAAGGKVLTIGPPLELAEEISFVEWQDQHKMQA